MSLLFTVLRSASQHESDDDDLINVVSPANTRPSSPTLKGAAARPIPKPLLLNKSRSRTDPLRVLPTELSQRIFSRLRLSDLAKCSLVSKKWNRSQTINYGQSTHVFRISPLTLLQSGFSTIEETTFTMKACLRASGPSANPNRTGSVSFPQ